jgi:hypothetical protein
MLQLAEVNWEAIFQPGNIPFAGIGMVTIWLTTCVIAGCWKHTKNHEKDVHLKQDLAARGYSVDEIERIVSVKPGSAKKK